ncbi:divalent-cation tolerance protein CutA [Candidatus Methylacidiphilum infernorum]|uniref:Periplasmic divalent cation tolerance protein cutA n=1 Tax=Methylacidiphilum infernorum (isolate V4) TaxID=481448 RepID=B3DUT8_METI4|nr:divalent-cation tolerance protein CutA [Candidatus Methylacidiphilum infernorum]ACD83091.1 Periplasmic divalent cation tolerance protein cutA [Methylacidiphilum infernorum V4]
MEPQIVLISCSNREEGEKIAKKLLQNRVASCINIIPQVHSFYWWEGNLEQAQEALLLVKSSKEKWDQLVTVIKESHSYQCPEIISLDPSHVFPPYLAWWQNELK